jgi:hypothetical protein
MRRLLMLIPLVLGLIFVGAASADAPTVIEESFKVFLNPYVDCGSFVVTSEGDVTRRITTFYNSDGTPIRRVFHISVDGTMTNSVTGTSLSLTREGTVTLDLVDGSMVTAGQRTRTVAPGEGIVLQDMGIIVREGGVIVFQAGPRDFLDYQLGDATGVQDLCAALA